MVKEIECDVYRSPKTENLYVYVPAGSDLAEIPTELMARFGEPEKALSFTLTKTKSLAKEDPGTVFDNLMNQGYHLQLPPADTRFRG